MSGKASERMPESETFPTGATSEKFLKKLLEEIKEISIEGLLNKPLLKFLKKSSEGISLKN